MKLNAFLKDITSNHSTKMGWTDGWIELFVKVRLVKWTFWKLTKNCQEYLPLEVWFLLAEPEKASFDLENYSWGLKNNQQHLSKGRRFFLPVANKLYDYIYTI